MAALGDGAIRSYHSASLYRPIGVYDRAGTGFLFSRPLRAQADPSAPKLATLRPRGTADRRLCAGRSAGTGIRARLFGATRCWTSALALPLLHSRWTVDRNHSSALVCLHGSDISIRHGRHPRTSFRRVSAILQLPVSGQCPGRRGRRGDSFAAHREARISGNLACGCGA
jgi:hypothetical protein